MQPNSVVETSSFPNPFSIRTEIRYNVSNPGRVRVVVFNSIGQHIATLVDAEQSAGSHSTFFDAGQLPNGVYYYRVQAGQVSQFFL